jgi:hypothetical protein
MLLLISACHDDRPPAPTEQQNAQLNEAAGMLDELGNEEGPEANAPGPSNSSD